MAEPALIDEQEYLTFVIENEEFGVDILSVQEIRVWSSVTEIPNTPDYLKGVINLRGIIVPIVDLRQRFNKSSTKYDATTVVIVLQAAMSGGKSPIGIVVDAVSDVYKVEPEAIKKTPNFGSHIDSRFIKGMATIAKKIIILLDTEKLLDVEQLFHHADFADISAGKLTESEV